MLSHGNHLGLALALALARRRPSNIDTNCHEAFVKRAPALLIEMREVDGHFVTKFGGNLFKREPVGFGEAPQEGKAGRGNKDEDEVISTDSLAWSREKRKAKIPTSIQCRRMQSVR